MFGIEYPKQIKQSSYEWLISKLNIETMEELKEIWKEKSNPDRIYISTVTSWQDLEDVEENKKSKSQDYGMMM